MKINILERLISEINNKHFLSEFTFTKNQFQHLNSYQKEFADCVIWLEDEMAIFQLKERDEKSVNNNQSEANWFKNKVIKIAKKQIKNSLIFFSKNKLILIENIKGHKFNVKTEGTNKIHKIIIYKHPELTAINLTFEKSSDIGFIHIFDFYDYLIICEVLDTPTEIFEFLTFRENLLLKYNTFVTTEKSILGLFLIYVEINNFLKEMKGKNGDLIVFDTEMENIVDKLKENKYEYDIEYIMSSLEKNIYSTAKNSTYYYKLLVEFSKMHRNERREFKKRWEKCAVDLLKNEMIIPYRLVLTKSNCGIVFIPLQREYYDNRIAILKNFTAASKYDLKLEKHIGISFCKKDNDVYVDYVYVKFPWRKDQKLERMLKENYPFRKLKEKLVKRYEFND